VGWNEWFGKEVSFELAFLRDFHCQSIWIGRWVWAHHDNQPFWAVSSHVIVASTFEKVTLGQNCKCQVRSNDKTKHIMKKISINGFIWLARWPMKRGQLTLTISTAVSHREHPWKCINSLNSQISFLQENLPGGWMVIRLDFFFEKIYFLHSGSLRMSRPSTSQLTASTQV